MTYTKIPYIKADVVYDNEVAGKKLVSVASDNITLCSIVGKPGKTAMTINGQEYHSVDGTPEEVADRISQARYKAVYEGAMEYFDYHNGREKSNTAAADAAQAAEGLSPLPTKADNGESV